AVTRKFSQNHIDRFLGQAKKESGREMKCMSTKRVGQQTIRLTGSPCISHFAAVGGKKEAKGPLGGSFDFLSEDAYFGAKSWESAESAMLKKCFDLVLAKAGLKADALEFIFTGDLLNQCVGSEFAIK